MLLKLAVGLAVLLALFVVFVASRPSAFRIARQLRIAAPAQTIFLYLVDFRAWAAWSPYEKLDPATQKRFDGPASGVGASYHYVGPKVGEGRMTITAAEPGRRVAIRAEFIRPFAAINQVEITLVPVGEEIEVTWAMSGHNNFGFKAFGVFVDLDAMIGKEFAQGLADLKALAEGRAVGALGTVVPSDAVASPV
jgi:uncharacterized protein YndB with AHSA1/START domain